jgi:hypothetical protein
VTKKAIISERADFDERFYPGLKKSNDPIPDFINIAAPAVAPLVVPPIVSMPDVDFDLPAAPDQPQVQNPEIGPNPPNAPPLAMRRPKRKTQKPGEWWKVSVPSTSRPPAATVEDFKEEEEEVPPSAKTQASPFWKEAHKLLTKRAYSRLAD